jgi:hypothetical protein
MAEKNFTCHKCKKDYPLEKLEEPGGRSPECGYNHQLEKDMEAIEAARAERKKEEDKNKPAPKKKLWGFS